MGANSLPAITIDGKLHRQVQEGLAQVLAPYLDESSGKAKKNVNNDEGSQSVFYNPIQQFNRDLSVLAILTYGEGAVVEKKARNVRKLEGKKARGKRAGAKTADEAQNGKKRKADELDEQRNVKRARAGSPGGEDELKPLEEPATERTTVTTESTTATTESTTATTESTTATTQSTTATTESTTATTASTTASTTATAEPTTTNAAETAGHAEPKQTKETKVPFTILDALSASGIRAMRYAREIPFATTIIANDFSQDAVRSIELNISHNDVSHVVHSNLGDARAFMYSKVGNERPPSPGYVHRFDVIDLDPYGTAAPFIDASLNAITDGGLLCVTCTDAGVFASNGYPEKAYALYGGIPLKGAHSHEAGLRLILNSIATTAAKYGIAIEPLLSLSIDFYARVFIRVHKSPSAVKLLAGTTMIVYSCDNGCGSWVTQPLARNQERVDRAGGTFFKHSFAQAPSSPQLCPLHNPEFVRRILDRLETADKTTYGTLDLIPRLPLETIDAAPLFFIPNYISKVLHCSVPTENAFRGALRHLGYRVTRSHCKAGSIKTNAPFAVIWEVMREWIRQRAPIKEGVLSKGQPGWEIMRKARDREDKTAAASAVRKSVVDGLESADAVTDVARVLKAGLWMCEHEKEPTTAASAVPDNTTDLSNPATVRPSQQSEKGDVSKLKVIFDENLGKEKPRNKLVRYQMNPRANWGPMNRAGGS
ncbi:hypothetical protein DV735_g4018, partial [Chaetothyriales sp. CBS 134920]